MRKAIFEVGDGGIDGRFLLPHIGSLFASNERVHVEDAQQFELFNIIVCVLFEISEKDDEAYGILKMENRLGLVDLIKLFPSSLKSASISPRTGLRIRHGGIAII